MAVYDDILDQVVTDVKGLSLTGVTSTNIVRAKVPTDDLDSVAAIPAVLIAPFGSPSIDHRGGTNEKDDIEYPVLVATIQEGNQDQTTNDNRSLQWQEDIRKKFIHQRLSGVTSVYTCKVNPRDAFDPGAYKNNYDVGWQVLRFVSRETRG